MPTPGGPSDKIGNRYEGWWTVSELVRMLQGQSDSIRIEDPGFDKAEFVVSTNGVRTGHQAKRSHPRGNWTIATLGGAKFQLLQAIGNSLTDNNDQFIFVSSSDARELAELTERARDSATAEEFERECLAAKQNASLFAKLCGYWGECELRTGYDYLKRIEVRTVDERGIEEAVRWGISALFLNDPADVVPELRAIAVDSVHQVITRDALIHKLAARGLLLRHLVSPASAALSVRDTTRRYLDGVRARLIGQSLVPRDETQTLLGILGNAGCDLVLTGKAGCGKTGCLIDFVEALQSRGTPVLAIRLDFIGPVSSANELGKKLNIEESPALVLAAAVEGREAVLVIDQLDAVSTASGRTTSLFLDAIEEMLGQARVLRLRCALHVVVVCREFDWEHDHRLRQLGGKNHKRISVGEFSADQVKKLLSSSGFEPKRFEHRQIELLQLPQNLSLFLGAGSDPTKASAFNTAAELFSRYWDAKRKSVQLRAGASPDLWMDVISILTEEMTRTQQLSVPLEKLDGIGPAYLSQMASEGVITTDGRRFGFGHESFFDYCFARIFITKEDSLVTFLIAEEQHLFRRAQVRQVLTYLRGADRPRYLRELADLLADSSIRDHLKDLALALLGSVTDPGDDERDVWEPLIQPMLSAIEAGAPGTAEKSSGLAWRHFFWSSSWFDFVNRKGLVASWLASGSDGLANIAVAYLRFHQRHSTDCVVELLKPYVDSGGDWPARLRSVVERGVRLDSRPLFDLTLRLIDNGAMDEARGPFVSNSTFWSLFDVLGNSRPDWVPEVIAHWLRRRLAIQQPTGARADVFGYDQFAEAPFAVAAAKAPEAFVTHVLPVILEASDGAAYPTGTPPKRDSIWPQLIKGIHLDTGGACLARLDQAIASLASDLNRNLRDVIDLLRSRNTYVANYLLLGLYTVGAARHADEAVDVVCAEPWRFECGYIDSSHWIATELIRAISPTCSAKNCSKLESAILAYVPPYERTPDGYKSLGYGCFNLLSALPRELRSAAGHTRFGELERKFRTPKAAPDVRVAEVEHSPIERSAAERMTDEQWLRAIDKYRSGNRLHFDRGRPRGGSWGLALMLQAFVREQPERFAHLSLKFPAGANAIYLARTLSGLEKSTIPNELKLAVCRKAYTESRETCGKELTDVFGAFEDSLPDDAVQMLSSLATEHPDPSSEAWLEDAGGGKTYFNGDIESNGINTTRGRAAVAILNLIERDAAYIPKFGGTLERMIHDPSTCVRSCVAGTLGAVAYHDPPLAVDLFGRMDFSDDRLLSTNHVYDFIRIQVHDYFEALRPIIQRMVRSNEPTAARAGARLVGIAVLGHQEAPDLDHEAARGTRYQRLGLAEVASGNIGDVDCRSWCEERLKVFFNDEDEGVRKEAASCFRYLQDESLEEYVPLIIAFCDSIAYRDDSFSILHLLENSRYRLPGITCVVCEKFLERFCEDSQGVRTGWMSGARTVTKLVFRTYNEHQNDEWTTRSLDLIDRLCLEGIDEAREELDAAER